MPMPQCGSNYTHLHQYILPNTANITLLPVCDSCVCLGLVYFDSLQLTLDC
jgi:hypothetical protein